MISALTAFVMALAVVVFATPLVRRLAVDVGAVDRPGERRRVHARVIPRLGGLAIVLGFFLPLLVLFGVETEVARQFFADPLRVVGLVAGGLLITGVGVFDDVKGVRPWTKLGVQVAAACVAYSCGYRIPAVSVPFFGHLDMGIFALPVTALWIVAIVNAINLIDGLDGLAGGVAFFACVTNFVVGWLNQDPLITLLSASLGGAVLGFLLFNFNPASIFMGDSGSLFLGYVLATTSIAGNYVKSSTTVAILVPLIAMGLPIVDTLFAMVRRFLEKRPIFSPDRGHIHHRLLGMGINHRRAVLILYALSILFTTGAILIAMGRRWQIGSALLVLSLAVIGVVRALGNFQVSLRRFRRGSTKLRSPGVERLRLAVPIALERIAATRDSAAITECLQDLGKHAELLAVELIDSQLNELPSFSWTRNPADGAEGEAVSASFALPGAGEQAQLRFVWTSDQGDVAPEVDILLQLVTDACDTRLSRVTAARERATRGHLRPI
jgi:UDP-GlcNAc:undecaprenyl-phosphate GlcNAc-1-phosphate transferase